MPAYKYKTSKGKVKWYANFFVTDWTGKRKRICKRGFDTKAEAKKYELDTLSMEKRTSDISFASLAENYLNDMECRLKPTTMGTKRNIIQKHIVPYFGELKLCDIDALRVRSWQNHLMSIRDENGKPFSQTYLRSIHAQLSAIMNYAVLHYSLAVNPCHVSGPMGKSKARAMKIWTREQYTQAISYEKKEAVKVAFDVLFYTGMRVGEMLALTPADILPDHKIRICKNFAVLEGEQLILEAKTDKSNRTIVIPDFLYDEIMDYIGHVYKIEPDERLFYFTKSMMEHELPKLAKAAGLETIRVHDLRHSHASMLIHDGVNILDIRDRLGHESVKTTLDTYGHLYPEAESRLVDYFNGLSAQDMDSGETRKKSPECR